MAFAVEKDDEARERISRLFLSKASFAHNGTASNGDRWPASESDVHELCFQTAMT